MVQRVQLILEDDLTGGPADETVKFALDGVSYEIDLSTENATKLREDLAAWVGNARRMSGRRSTTTKSTKSDKRDTTAVREWLRANGHEVSDRGRISRELMALYDAAN